MKADIHHTSPLFDDLPVPPPRRKTFVSAYAHQSKTLRTAQYFARQMVESADARRKTECYLNMIAAVLAKDGVR
jgi:hypothetical protein